MKALDTNVLARVYIDDPGDAQAAHQLSRDRWGRSKVALIDSQPSRAKLREAAGGAGKIVSPGSVRLPSQVVPSW